MENYKLKYKNMMVKWKSLGVTITDITEVDVDGVHTMTLHIDVPGTSDIMDDNGNELSGKLLIKRIRKEIDENGYGKVLFIDPTICEKEHWTKEMSDTAKASMTFFTFGKEMDNL